MLTGCYSFAITSSCSTKGGWSSKGLRKSCSPTTVYFTNFIWRQWDPRRRKLQPILHASDQRKIASAGVKIVSIIKRSRLSTIFSRPQQTTLPGGAARQTTTKRRKDSIWQRQRQARNGRVQVSRPEKAEPRRKKRLNRKSVAEGISCRSEQHAATPYGLIQIGTGPGVPSMG